MVQKEHMLRGKMIHLTKGDDKKPYGTQPNNNIFYIIKCKTIDCDTLKRIKSYD